MDIVGTRADNDGRGLGGSQAFEDSSDSTEGEGDSEEPPPESKGQELPNTLEIRIGASLAEVNEKLNSAFEQLFFGNEDSQAVYREQDDGTAYVEDIQHQDVRTDSMGYGMLVAVQLREEEVFDRLWSWTKKYMLNTSGPSAGLLNWNCTTEGNDCSATSSTDAMSIIATALFLAESRFPDGIHDYDEDANLLLDAMIKIEERNDGIVDGVVNSFDLEQGLPRWGSATPDAFVPVEYIMPAFYEYWAQKRPEEKELWLKIADSSRVLVSKVSAPNTGLYPGAVYYTGVPVPDWLDYTHSTSRTHLNLALDHLHFGPHGWLQKQNELLLDFFLDQGVNSYAAEYSYTGEPLVSFNTPAHRSMVALAAGTTLKRRHDLFLEDFFNQATPTGTYRYFDGMLYLLSLVVLSGQFSLD